MPEHTALRACDRSARGAERGNAATLHRLHSPTRHPRADMAAASDSGIDVIDTKLVEPLRKFFDDAKVFIDRCDKPKFDEMRKISGITLTGFLIMGVIGFFVKLFAMPLNQVLIS